LLVGESGEKQPAVDMTEKLRDPGAAWGGLKCTKEAGGAWQE
jgi:hypothetical protein